MGGGDQSGSSPQMQQLLQLQKRQQLADSFKQAFQGIGGAVGQQQAYMPLGQGAGAQPLATAGAQPLGGAGAQALGQGSPAGALFASPGAGGGISEAQLAAILQQLGYGGQAA
jgi:hypothetical protein